MTEPIRLQSRVLAGEEQGPHLLITGGVHGDEFEPMVAIRRLARQVEPKSLRGTLTLVPVVNESAFRRKHRCAEDGLYLELTDWLPTVVDMKTIHPNAVKYLCEYPSGSGKYFAA